MTSPNRAPGELGRRRLLRLLLAVVASALGAPHVAGADDSGLRIVIHPSNPLSAASRDFVTDAFLKKTTSWQHGGAILAVDLRPDNAVRRRFCLSVLKRSVGAVRSYWQQRIFSGRDVPPPELDSEDGVVAYVAKYPGGIGYVSAATKLTGVKELLIR